MNLYKSIPTILFPENKISVGYPLNEPLVYLDDYFDCDSKYNHIVPLYAGILDAKLRCSVPYSFLDEIQKLDNLQQSLLLSLIKTRNKFRELSGHMTDLIIANTV